MSVQYVDFILDGFSSKKLKLKRTSDGARYREVLLPPTFALTTQVPGADGSYFFGSNWGERRFQIDCAFDDLGEGEIRQLKRIFSKGGLMPLVFTEHPYKEYMVRIESEPYFEYLPFDLDERSGSGRVYKGELSIPLVSHRSYATSTVKNLATLTTDARAIWGDTVAAEMANLFEPAVSQEWNKAADLIDLSQYDLPLESEVFIYNPGDLPTDVKIYFTFPTGINAIQLSGEGAMTFNTIVRKGEDVGFFYNSETHLLEGFTGSAVAPIKSNNIYNEYITSGTFFKIPVTTKKIPDAKKIVFIGGVPSRIEYKYRYF